MIDDLQVLSEDYMTENRNMLQRGYEGSPIRGSPVTGLPDRAPGVPYTQSQTSRRSDRSDRSDSLIMNPQDPSYGGDRFQPSPYSSASGQPGYTTTAGYPPGSNYPPSQMSAAYQPSQAYPPVVGYPAASNYPPGSGYPSGSGYPATSGYSPASYPAPVGRPGIMADPNYTYDTPDYPGPNYQYGRPQNSYTGASRPGDPRADARLDPRSATAYPYVASAQDPSMRGATTDPRFDQYGQPITSNQASRGGFPAPPRGTPTGVYDPPQPMDGFRTDANRHRR